MYLLIIRQVPTQETLFYSHIWNVVEFFLNPVLLFAVFYYATRRMELRYGYSVTMSLLLGSLIVPAAFAVYGLSTYLPLPYPSQTNIAFVVSSLLKAVSQGLQTFFVSFTAMIMASISE